MHLKTTLLLLVVVVLFWPTKHDYYVAQNQICPAEWRCSESLIKNIYFQIRNGIPGNGSDGAIISGRRYTVYLAGIVPWGKIFSYTGSGNPAISNHTTLAHLFYDGWAIRSFQKIDGAWYSSTHGFGTNYIVGFPMAIANQIFGPRIFQNLDDKVRNQLRTAAQHSD
jgi:hypothetical protein